MQRLLGNECEEGLGGSALAKMPKKISPETAGLGWGKRAREYSLTTMDFHDALSTSSFKRI